MEGYISIWRQLRDNWTWKEFPFSSGQAWVDLIMRAAWKKHTVTYQKQLIELRRGQHATSERQLGRDWGWSRNRVKSFLKRCEQSRMIEVTQTLNRVVQGEVRAGNEAKQGRKRAGDRATTATTKGPGYIVVTICNYNAYQVPPIQPGHGKTAATTTKGPGTLPAPGRVRATSGPVPGHLRATREEREEGEKGKKGEAADPPSPPGGPDHGSAGGNGHDPILNVHYARSMSPSAAKKALELAEQSGTGFDAEIEAVLKERSTAEA
jgi:hypothetical protein